MRTNSQELLRELKIKNTNDIIKEVIVILGGAFFVVAMLLLLMIKIGEPSKYANYLTASMIFIWLTIVMIILLIIQRRVEKYDNKKKIY